MSYGVTIKQTPLYTHVPSGYESYNNSLGQSTSCYGSYCDCNMDVLGFCPFNIKIPMVISLPYGFNNYNTFLIHPKISNSTYSLFFVVFSISQEQKHGFTLSTILNIQSKCFVYYNFSIT